MTNEELLHEIKDSQARAMIIEVTDKWVMGENSISDDKLTDNVQAITGRSREDSIEFVQNQLEKMVNISLNTVAPGFQNILNDILNKGE